MPLPVSFLTDEVRQDPPWPVMFADDIVICHEIRKQVEEKLQRWRFFLESRGMKVSHSKRKNRCENQPDPSG